MKTKIAFIFVAAAFILALALPSAASQESSWISLVKIVDANTGTDYTAKPVLTGGVYNFTFKVTIPFNAPDDLIMNTPLNQSGSQYWYLRGTYSGINMSTWTPAKSSISFKQVKGNATFSLIGTMPANVTLRYAEWDGKNIALHFANDTYPVVTLRLRSSSDRVGLLAVKVQDQTIANYQTTLQNKQNLTKTTNIETSYSVFLNAVLTQAKELYQQGYVSEATRILNSIPSTVPLNPGPESPLALILGGALVAVIVVAILTAILTLKARSQLAVLKSDVHEAAANLDTSLVKLERLDRVLASDVQSVRDRLKDVSA